MKIRSITTFFDPQVSGIEQLPPQLAAFNQAGRQIFTDGGYVVQTTRLASTPFPGWYQNLSNPVACVRNLEQLAMDAGFDYLAIGPALAELMDSFQFILPVLENTKNVFIGGMMATASRGISLPAVQACARVVTGAAGITPDGFTNLRFCATANVQPYGPFFPSAYSGGQPAFSLAIESADVVLEEFRRASSLAEARKNLLDRLNHEGTRLETLAHRLGAGFGMEFKGIDFSSAPFPEDWCSAGGALEQLGVGQLGLAGSLAAAAFLADTLDRGEWKRAGFNGLMLPVLEDSGLAGRSGQPLTLKDLLLFSAVCGTGLDTVPLAGTVTTQQIEAILLDVAALSVRLNKPLTARLMPVPGKAAGEVTTYDFAYFCNGKVMDLAAGPLTGLLTGDEIIEIGSRSNRTR